MPGLAVGAKAPDATVTGIDGTSVQLASLYKDGRSFTGETARATAIQPNMQQLLVRINEDWDSMSPLR